MHSYLINLDSRPDRLQQATEQLNSIGIAAERFRAFTPDEAYGNRPLAFNKSQYYCIKKAVDEGHERFAIFEDDVMFTPGAVSCIAKAVNDLPSTFHCLHLGCNIIGMSTTQWIMPSKYSDNIGFLKNCWQTHAIVWSVKGARLVLDRFDFYKDIYAKEGLMIFDEWLRQNLYGWGRSFVMRPMVAYQRPDFSDIWHTHGDYTSSFELGNKYLMGL